MNDHLSAQGKLNPKGGFYSFGLQTKLEPLILVHMVHQNHQKQIKIEKVTTPQSKGGQELKKKTIKHYKA
jgi:hypothetical protein